MAATLMKIGELAKQTGISVRTLHYYDEIGLLSPSHRTNAEHRLYTAEDIARLQQIMCLRALGFSLEEIRTCLENPAYSLQYLIALHITRLHEQIAVSHRLLNRLEVLAQQLQTTNSVSIEHLIQTMETITMFEKYFTPKQQQLLQQHREQLGEERIHQIKSQWQALIPLVREQMNNGTDPTSPTVLELARRWRALVQEFTGGHREIHESLVTMYRLEGAEVVSQGILDTATFEYISKSLSALEHSQQ
jgi:DNA-binding transcriptional MerR regulator